MWKEFEISISSTKLTELGISNSERSRLTIDMSEIIGYYEIAFDNDNLATNIVIKGGSEFGVHIPYDDFDNLMKQYAKS